MSLYLFPDTTVFVQGAQVQTWQCYRDKDCAWIQQRQLSPNKFDLAKPPVSLTYLQKRQAGASV